MKQPMNTNQTEDKKTKVPERKPKCRDCGMLAPKDLSLCYECFAEYRKDDSNFKWE